MPNTLYVRKTGSDSNTYNQAQSPSTAWLTIGHALGASGAAAGDTVYVGPGVYRETVSCATSGSAGNVITIIGDVDGSHTGDTPGEIRLTPYSVNDTTLPGTTNQTLNLNGKSFLAFQNLSIIGGKSGGNNTIDGGTSVSTNITITDCAIFGPAVASATGMVCVKNTASTALNWTIDRCRFMSPSMPAIALLLVANATAEHDVTFLCQNCLFVSCSNTVNVTVSTSSTFFPYGYRFKNNSYIGVARAVLLPSGWTPTNPTITVNNCLILATSVGLNANNTSQVSEDYNIIYSPTARTSVTAGANSKSDFSYWLGLHIGQELQQGKTINRPLGMPTSDSPILAFTTANSPTSYDLLNRPRPSGGGPTWTSANDAVGCYERHDFGVPNTTTFDTSPSIQLAGPGDHYLQMAVDATSTTISIKCNRDANYGGGTNPTLTLLANAEIGVATQSVTDSGSASQWNTISLSSFTPTAKGVVTLQLVSNSAGNGNCYFDTITVS